MTDVEVEQDGKKIKTNKGEIKITVEAILEKDYEENWEKRAQWKFLRGIYDKYIMRTTNDNHEDWLKEDTLKFLEDLKAFLQLETKR